MFVLEDIWSRLWQYRPSGLSPTGPGRNQSLLQLWKAVAHKSRSQMAHGDRMHGDDVAT